MENIATLSNSIERSGTPKLKKKEAQVILERIYDELPTDNLEKTAEHIRLAQLYRYFMPAKPKKATTDMEWVHKAAETKGHREYLKFAYSDGEFLVATDGARLHAVSTDLGKGFYDRAGNLIEGMDKNHSFPDWKGIITPPGFSTEKQVVELDKCKLHTYRGTHLYEIDERFFDKKLVDEFANGYKWFFMIQEHYPIFIDAEAERFGTIMPMRIKTEDIK